MLIRLHIRHHMELMAQDFRLMKNTKQLLLSSTDMVSAFVFLADWHAVVCPSVTLCIVAQMVGVSG